MNEHERVNKIGEWAQGALDEMNHMTVPEAEMAATVVLADIVELARHEHPARYLQPDGRTWQAHARIMGWRAPD